MLAILFTPHWVKSQWSMEESHTPATAAVDLKIWGYRQKLQIHNVAAFLKIVMKSTPVEDLETTEKLSTFQ